MVLLWLVVGHAVAASDLSASRAHGQESLKVLNDARISSLQARANENLTLVARGAVLTEDGKDQYEADFNAEMAALAAELGSGREARRRQRGRRTGAHRGGPRPPDGRSATPAARRTDDGGDYDGALTQVIGGKGSTGECFDKVDAELDTAIAHEQQRVHHGRLRRPRTRCAGCVGARRVLAVLAAAGAGLGISRRLAEYR